MSNRVAASMTASIIIDKKEVISSALEAYARAKKEIDGNKLELLVDVSDDEALKRLKEIQKELSGKDYIIKFKNQGIDETLKSLDELYEKIKAIISGKNLGNGKGNGVGNSIVDEKTIENVLELFTKVEGHLGELRKTISDVGDGDEFSPLLKMIKEVSKSISELSESMSKIKLNLNVDLGATNEEKLNAKVAQANHRQLEGYRKLFSSMKASGKTNMQMLKFFEPDDASVSELVGIYRDLIQKIEKEVYGKRNLNAKNIFKEEYKEIENARAAFNRANKSQEKASPLGELFGGTDLTEVIKQLELIAEDLKNISSVATEFKNSFQNGFNVTASVEEIEKLTNKVKELESELDKLKTSSVTSVETNISSPITDTFQGDAETEEMKKVATATDEAVQEKKDFAIANEGVQDSVDDSKSKLELEANLMKSIAENSEKAAKAKKEFVEANKTVSNSARTSAEDLEQERNVLDDLGRESGKHSIELGLSPIIDSAKKLDDTLDNIEISTDSFNEVLEKLDLTKSKLGEIVRITKQAHANADGKMIESYILKDSVGSTETYGASSNTEKGQMLAYKYISDNTKAINEQRKAEKELQRQQEKSNAEKLKEEENKKIAKQKENYDELNRTIDRYITIRKRIAKGESLSSDKQEAENLKKSIDDLHKTDLLSEEQYKNTKIRLDNLETSVKDIVALTRQSTFDSMQSDIDRYYKRLNNLKIKPSDIDRSSGYTEALNEYEAAIRKLENHLTKLRGATEEITEKDIKDWEDLTSSVQEASDKIRAFSSAQKGSSVHSREKEIDKLTKYLKENTKISKTARKELERYLDLLKSGDASTNVQEIHTEWTKVAVAEREAGREGKAFFDILGDKTLYGYAAQLAQYYLSLMDFVRYARAVFDNVIEINTAQTELRKVSDATESRLTENFKTSAKAAKDLGATITDVISATADWSRMGYNVDDAEELARISTLYKNVGDGIDIETANNSLISTLQGFQLTADEAEGVIDKFNEVANNFAIDSAGIGEALQRSAASFNAANTDLSKSIVLITATNEEVQDPDSVGKHNCPPLQ